MTLLYALGIGNHTLWGYQEPYTGATIREMAHHLDFVVPTLNGRPFLEKPPFAYLLAALVCRAAGHYEPWALRLPSMVLALATCGWVGFIACRLGSARAGIWAGITLATSFEFFETGHTVQVDMTFTAAVTFALGLAFLAIVEPHHRRRWVSWLWVGLGASFLAKGMVGPVMVLAPVALTLVLEHDRALFRELWRWNWGMAAALLCTFVWVATLGARGGTHFLAEVFLRNSLGRFVQHPALVSMTATLGQHVEPWYYYLVCTPGSVLPWSGLWLGALGSAVPRRRQPLPARSYFLPLAFAVNFLLLSCSLTKREIYLLPALPITFLHLALWLDLRVAAAGQGRDALLSWTMAFTLGLMGLVTAGFTWMLVKETGVSPLPAAANAVLVLCLAAWSVQRLRRRDYPGAFKGLVLQWLLLLALVVWLWVPAVDRQDWEPLQGPYRQALLLRQAGYSLAGAGLSETQLGFSSLTLQQVLPMLERPDQLQSMLDRAEPVAVLVEPGWWAQVQASGVRGTLVPTEADAVPPKQRGKAPVLVINREPSGPKPGN